MSFGEVIFPNFVQDTWSDGRSSSCSSSQSSDSGNSLNFSSKDFGNGFNTFSDTFGLSNLLSNVQISDDNPLLQSTQKNLSLLQRARRQSWGSDGSDSAAVLSPTIESQSNYDRFDLNNNNNNNMNTNSDKFLQHHQSNNSMRFGSRNIRDHNLINNAYPPQNENRPSVANDKLIKPPLILPSSPIAPNLPNPLTMPPPPALPTTTPAGPNNNRGGNNSNNNGVHVCVFCRNNGESESVYTSHVLKDGDGRTSCPILRAYTCPICKANGDNSHTIKYCPMNQNAGLFPRPGQQQQQPSFRTPFPPPPPPPNMPMGNQFPNFQRNKNSFR